MKYLSKSLIIIGLALLSAGKALSQNPLIRDQYSADPTARVFGNTIYVYPSHDILATEGHGHPGWFCMADYHVFSSTDLTNWTDHGVIISQNKVAWADSTAYSMWAPDCIYANGKYYFYFPTKPLPTYGDGFMIGVAIANHPQGPFVPQPKPIKDVHGIDPNVFIDNDGQAYLYYAEGNIYGAKLKGNMLELATQPQILGDLPAKGLKEGPFIFERKSMYYLTYPHVANKTERLEYAMGTSPLGPFKYEGVIMDESASGCWTNHHSLIRFKGQWYLFYHDDDLSVHFDKARSIRADSLFFNPDGTIRKVLPTYRGVGITKASREIQIDRYSEKSGDADVSFLDTANTFEGWKITLKSPASWVRYNKVDFGKGKLKHIIARVLAKNGPATITIYADKENGLKIASLKIEQNSAWKLAKSDSARAITGIHDLFIEMTSGNPTAIDWISFKR